MNVTNPTEIPVTVPVLSTVATPGLLLIHVPPEVGDNTSVAPTQKVVGAVNTGNGLTITGFVVLVHPPVALVNVNSTVPADTALTKPELFTVAIALSLLDHVPPEVGVKLVDVPKQISVGDVIIGLENTVTKTEILLTGASHDEREDCIST
jgi:hypothetical protein